MNTNTDFIRERIKAAANKKQNVVKIQSVPVSENKNGSSLTTFLGICVIMLSVGTVWAIFQKNMASKTIATTVSPTNVQSQVSPLISNNNDLSNDIAEQNKKLEDLTKRMETWSNRTWLLGVAHNENMNLTRKIQQRQNVGDPGYIVFDENWKLNRVPTTMEMTEDQKRKLIQTSESK
jgi:cell division protein FtsL